MSVKVSRTIWFGNGYGVELIVTSPYEISFNVITEKDPTMVATENFCIGSDVCYRGVKSELINNDTVEDDVISGSEESMRDFAIRARAAGISFAEEVIIEYKETLDLGTILDEVVGSFDEENPTTKQ